MPVIVPMLEAAAVLVILADFVAENSESHDWSPAMSASWTELIAELSSYQNGE